MRKKLFILLFLTMFITGCSVDYNIEIYNNDINEHIDLTYAGSNSAQDTKIKVESLFDKYFSGTDYLYMRRFKLFEDEQKKMYGLREKSKYKFE